MRASCAFVVLAACGHIGFETVTDAGGGGGGDGSPPRPWLAVATGGKFACGIRDDRSLWCWGMIPLDPLGKRFEPPVQIAGSWSSVSVGTTAASPNDHTCGIQSDGSLWCWGFNTYGGLGNGSTGDSPLPSRVGTATWTAVAAGDAFTCGLQTDRSLWCWGNNMAGQLGDGTSNQQVAPEQVAGTWIAIATGDSYACGIRSDSSLWCWGDNSAGELGDGTMSDQASPEEIGAGFTAIAASPTGDHTCGVTGGVVECWGHNGLGQLGDSTTNAALAPIDTGRTAQQVAVGDNHSCAVDSGTLWCWGDGQHGELATAAFSLVPVQIASAAAVATGENQTCILGTAGQLSCTGRNSFGQLGPAIPPGEVHVQTQMDTHTDWAAIAAGGTHTCGTTITGETLCWGLNLYGELGDGTAIDRQQPVLVATGAGGTSQVTAGDYTTLLVSGAGDASLIGRDPVSGMNENTPEPLAMTGWTFETAGDAHSCGLAGTALWCRGDDSYGQIGDGNTSGTQANYQVPGTWAAVSAGWNTTCGSTSGQIVCWGDGSFGQSGDGTTNSYSSPHAVTASGGAPLAISVANEFVCAIRSPGALWCWGENAIGQLGDGTSTDRHSPVLVGTKSNWISLASGFVHSCAIDDSHALYCWGGGGEGELGDDYIGNHSSPTQVGTDTDWLQVAIGWGYTCALKTDHTRWCWGTDYNGQLGNGLAWHAGFVEVP